MNKGASVILLILVILGLVFLAQYVGFNVQLYWPIIVIVFVAVVIWGGGK